MNLSGESEKSRRVGFGPEFGVLDQPPPAADSEPLLWFYAPGEPVPQGSKSAFASRKKNGKFKVRLVEGGNLATKTKRRDRLKNWRAAVGHAAARARAKAGLELVDDGIVMGMVFVMPRPDTSIVESTRALPRNKQRLVKGALECPSVKPDLSKLIRAVEDGLEGILFSNDSRIVGYRYAYKVYDDEHPPGVFVEMWRCD